MAEITELLNAWAADDTHGERLLPLIYEDLQRIARHQLRHERIDHSWPPAALVHETFLRLLRQHSVSWQSRGHFFRVASRLMRRLLIDSARRKRTWRQAMTAGRGWPPPRTTATERWFDVLALDEALDQLASRYPEHAEVIELRFFGGLTRQEAAAALGVSVPTVSRRWRVARAWLYRALRPGGE